jgi:hypothetical protein
MGIFDKLKYGNTFGNTVSIRDTVVKQYPKKEEPKVEEPKIEEEIIEEIKPKKKSSKTIIENTTNPPSEDNEE